MNPLMFRSKPLTPKRSSVDFSSPRQLKPSATQETKIQTLLGKKVSQQGNPNRFISDKMSVANFVGSFEMVSDHFDDEDHVNGGGDNDARNI